MWTVTDPSNNQFSYQLNNTTYYFIEFSNKDLNSSYLYDILRDNFKKDSDALETVLDERGFRYNSALIDLNDYSHEEIDGYISGYYSNRNEVYDWPEANQIIAECIFETDYIYE